MKKKDSEEDFFLSSKIRLSFKTNFFIQRKMKFFKSLQKAFDILGIYEPKQSTPQWNWRNFVSMFSLVLYATGSGIYLFVEAQTFSEFAESFYSAYSLCFLIITGSLTISQTVLIYELIHDFDGLIRKREREFSRSKSHHLYLN